MTKPLLIIFVKNAVAGKVKTRLAATVGPEKAVAVYQLLLRRTQAVTRELPVAKVVYYSDYPEEDNWSVPDYTKRTQAGADLGERMHDAFRREFAAGYTHICLIGSDCYELTAEIILQAFEKLTQNDVVIGPAEDGGYYLVGLKSPHASLFIGKIWSTSSVLADTLYSIKAAGQTVALLPQLTDVDEEKDLSSIREVDF